MMITVSGATHSAESISQSVEPRTHPSILLVNHEESLQRALGEQGFDVLAAVEGIRVFEALRRSVPDAVVVDLDGPRSLAVALAEELQDWGLPLVLTTSARDRPVIPNAEILEKPFDISDLVALLTRTVERGKAQSNHSSRQRRVISR
jgi:DNA-binding response OmpR family regulator